MDGDRDVDVAVLLATYNGERHLRQQINSLTCNESPFTLHWLDDQSTDRTREIVRSCTRDAAITLKEWHHPQRQKVPGAFFQLLESVEADIYLFCDQDDIWQPGKIDATVEALSKDVDCPVICFTDPLCFRDSHPERQYRSFEILRITEEAATQESRMFLPSVGYGHTEGFTRSLRDLYMRHRHIARSHAIGHDVWMYNIAVASGSARYLPESPTTLYRWHGDNSSGAIFDWTGTGLGRFTMTIRQCHLFRKLIARHAEGFIMASPTLPQSAKLDRLLEIARLIAKIHHRQPPATLLRLLRNGALWPNMQDTALLATACLLWDVSGEGKT